MMVVRNDPSAPWRIIGDHPVENVVDVSDETGATSAGTKRPRSSSTTDINPPEAKRARASPAPATLSAPCLAPSPNITADAIFTSREKNGVALGAGDIFLTEGWRDRWCHCSSVSLTIPFCCLNIQFSVSAILPWNQDHSFCMKKKPTSLPKTLILAYHLRS
jgi:hypothetical protein